MVRRACCLLPPSPNDPAPNCPAPSTETHDALSAAERVCRACGRRRKAERREGGRGKAVVERMKEWNEGIE
eukprot:2898288-Rhodomonas_salina.1